MAAPLIVEMIRGRTVESRHRVHAAVVDSAGRILQFAGDGGARIYPRSALKPLQAAAMVDAGLDLTDPELLAVSAASHSGEQMHVDAVRRILGSVGLTESDLGNVPAWPYDEAVRIGWIASGGERTRVRMNCSGKHAAMLATCVAAGWPLANYLSPDHPLQVWLRRWIDDLLGEGALADTITDGCGAPIWTIPLPALAHGFAVLAAGDRSAAERVATAMMSRPEYVGGSHRDVTSLMRGVPGLLAKDGAEGVYAAALRLMAADSPSRSRTVPAAPAPPRWPKC